MNNGKTEKNNFLIQNDQFFTKGVEIFRKNVRVDNKFILICQHLWYVERLEDKSTEKW